MVIGNTLLEQGARPPGSSPETPVAGAARRLARACVSALPVVDSEGRPVGLVAERDTLSRAVEDVMRRAPGGAAPAIAP